MTVEGSSTSLAVPPAVPSTRRTYSAPLGVVRRSTTAGSVAGQERRAGRWAGDRAGRTASRHGARHQGWCAAPKRQGAGRGHNFRQLSLRPQERGVVLECARGRAARANSGGLLPHQQAHLCRQRAQSRPCPCAAAWAAPACRRLQGPHEAAQSVGHHTPLHPPVQPSRRAQPSGTAEAAPGMPWTHRQRTRATCHTWHSLLA